jgi:hypothetical protein
MDYDAVGFDVDHSLAKLNVVELMKLSVKKLLHELTELGYS